MAAGLKYFRQQAGLTQLELSRMLRIKERKICLWETGRAEVSVDEAVDIARVLNVLPEEMFPEMFNTIK